MNDDGTSPDGAFDPADSLRLIREQTDRARDATEPDGRLLFGAWGIAWLVGYLAMWAGARQTGVPPPGQAGCWRAASSAP